MFPNGKCTYKVPTTKNKTIQQKHSLILIYYLIMHDKMRKIIKRKKLITCSVVSIFFSHIYLNLTIFF